MFIVFEGGEGTGKTTQIRALAAFLEEKLQGSSKTVVVTWEPGGTPLGEKIRSVLIDPLSGALDSRCEALLYAAARAEHVDKVIRPALKAGHWVLCDRYIDASKAYQGEGRGLGMAAVEQVNQWATYGIEPDLVFLFDIDPKLGLERVKQRQKGNLDRIEAESLKFHDSIRQAYLFMAKAKPQRYKVIDATRSIELVKGDLQSACLSLLQK